LKKINVAILGCGRMGQRHAEAYARHSSVKIGGFFDVQSFLAKKLANSYNTIAYRNLDQIMNDSSINAVSICTPNALHFEMLKSAIESEKNILVEKPIVTTAKQCDSLLRLIRKFASRVMVGHTHRFYPCNLALKSLLDSGRIGKPRIINTFDYIPGRNPGQKMPKWVKQGKISGGGVLMTDFIHTVDKIPWLMSSPIRKVHAHLMSNFISGFGVEDAVVASIELANGAVATCVHGCPSPGAFDMSVKVIGTKGEVDMKFAAELIIIKNRQISINYPYRKKPLEHTKNAFFSEIDEFVQSIIEKRRPVITHFDGIRAVNTILALYKSFKEKRAVVV
jgi:predicted dehydrogenase